MPGSCSTSQIGWADVNWRWLAQVRRKRLDWRSFLAKLVRTILLVPMVSAGLWAVAANAATGDARDGVTRAGASGAVAPMQLAQSGDVEIYVDEYGRRVIVDSFTGEVLGMQRPQERPATIAASGGCANSTATRAASCSRIRTTSPIGHDPTIVAGRSRNIRAIRANRYPRRRNMRCRRRRRSIRTHPRTAFRKSRSRASSTRDRSSASRSTAGASAMRPDRR